MFKMFKMFKIVKWHKLYLSLVGLILLLLILNYTFPLRLKIDYSTIVLDNKGKVVHAFLTNDEKWRMKTELEEITPTLKTAILFKEDRFFYYHPGVNPFSIIRALWNNLSKQKRTSGASTITMQITRMLEPKERTYINKFKEMFRAFQLEWMFSKDEILQLYFNLLPYGGNIEGVKAASVLYFEKSPDQLSLAEITALSIIPNRPSSLVLGSTNDLILKERDKWLKRYKEDKLFDDQAIEDALEESLDVRRHQSPKRIPHLSYRLKSKYVALPIIQTFIDFNKQEKIEGITTNYINRLYYRNIKNAAVLVVDNKTGQVVTYIGSADFYNKEDAGQVDGVRAIRSPGSTLKPLLYGIAIDKGLLTPKIMISDVPTNFGPYAPENYDQQFHGKINVEFALSNSLNVPAVKVLNDVGVNEFILKLKNAGFSQIAKDESKLGLSMVLGGCGVTLEELTSLFYTFANNGVNKPIGYIKDQSNYLGQQIISSAASFMVTETLMKVTRPDLPLQWRNSAHLPTVAWKTGTSYGRKDAWSIGYNQNYTVGVWIGNFSGIGVPDLSGAAIAAPLLFQIFNTLDYDSDADWFFAPESVDFRFVCSETGMVPSEFCENSVMDYFIPGVSSSQKCDHLSKTFISMDSTLTYCTSCLPSAGYKTTYYPNHPPEIITWFEANQVSYLKPPAHNPDCERVFVEGPPLITSPVDGMEYLIDKSDTMQIMLSCNANNDVSKVYWYVNNRFYKSSEVGQSEFFTPTEGKVKISCTDDKGRNTDISITVKAVSL